MRYKQMNVEVKTGGELLTEGQFEAYASTFVETPDSYGDVVAPGAFKESLEQWANSKGQLPVLWGHDLDDPFNNVGYVVKAEEDDKGLKVVGELDLDNPTAKQVYRLLKTGRVNKMSFAYDIVDSAMVTKGGQDVFELRKVNLHEVSVVTIPANPTAEVLAVKHVDENGESTVQLTRKEILQLKKWVAEHETSSQGGEADSKPETKSVQGEGSLSEAVRRVKEMVNSLEIGVEQETDE